MSKLAAHLEVLPKAQRRLWAELPSVPEEFVLYGGTALALHLGHRHSIDFDFFADRDIDPDKLQVDVSFLAGADIVQRAPNTLTAVVHREDPILVSFFGVPKLPRLAAPVVASDTGLKVASLLDLAGTKVSVLQVRAEAKDYLDVDALITLGGVGLPAALAAARKLYGASFNPQVTLKALSYFGDGNLGALPEATKVRLVKAAREVDLDHLPELETPKDGANRIEPKL
jgi:hypothetical protein